MAEFFIISGEAPVASIVGIPSSLGGGCIFSSSASRDALTAGQPLRLVSARKGRVSRAKKWRDWEVRKNADLPVAREVAPGQFLLDDEEEE